MEFCSFASGSSGNCYMIKTEETTILVDAGISGKKIMEGLKCSGASPESVSGVFITHEHSDHVKSIRVLMKKLPAAQCYATSGTWEDISDLVPDESMNSISAGDRIQLGDLSIRPFRISHDAKEPVGYTVTDGQKNISIITDTGCLTEELLEEAKAADLLVLESNHDVDVMRTSSRYPLYVQRRILGDRGHLSNETAGRCICRITREAPKKRRILLAHLSSNHNTPDLALVTINSILEEHGIHPGRDLMLEVIERDLASCLYEV